MEYKKTLERLSYFVENSADNPAVSEDTFNMALDCLEAIMKLIPEKPTRDSMDKAYLCPTCRNPFTCWKGYQATDIKFDYCPSCGQAIDWE